METMWRCGVRYRDGTADACRGFVFVWAPDRDAAVRRATGRLNGTMNLVVVSVRQRGTVR